VRDEEWRWDTKKQENWEESREDDQSQRHVSPWELFPQAAY